jgi:hypothetical protein
MPDLSPEQIQQVEATLTAVAAGALVSKWVVVMETIDGPTGEPQLEMLSPDATPLWDTMGLLDFELTALRGRIETPRDGD